ncbi:helix-turn-helix domain-containing protein [Flavobacterium sp. MK4S-17]|uniref:helix-turn-helix domain-containing protein n=1 Tax=Flavobacterium sp. MK4S-17 TaxID=2543737 RepID=UPI00135A5E8D|nr:helix-turn-helix domain-containing protein [Flavobacterium sp. MK4S-17]
MDSKGIFLTAQPASDIVGKYISYYYFHSSGSPEFQKKFFFYPNYKHALTLYKGSKVTFTPNGSEITPSTGNDFYCLYSVNTDKNYTVNLTGPFFKIGVVFNPLGINHFINEPLGDIFKPAFDELNKFKGLDEVADAVLKEGDVKRKADLLDNYFEQHYIGFNEPVVKKAVQEILNSNGSIKVEELSDVLEVSRKTLLRLFKKHLCCTVEEYKKMVMFRNALNYAQTEENFSLTDVALFNLYYDQAHFIKHFKTVTEHSPKMLLSKLTRLGNQQLYWNFED